MYIQYMKWRGGIYVKVKNQQDQGKQESTRPQTLFFFITHIMQVAVLSLCDCVKD